MFVILFTAAAIGSIYNYSWLVDTGQEFNAAYNWYHLAKDSPLVNERFTHARTIALIQFPSSVENNGEIKPEHGSFSSPRRDNLSTRAPHRGASCTCRHANETEMTATHEPLNASWPTGRTHS